MVEVEEVVTEVRVDDMDFDRKMRRIDRELESVERDAKRRGRGRGAALVGGIAGAVAGTVAGAAQGNQAVSATLDLLFNVVAAVLLPVIVALLPLVEALTPILIGISNQLAPLITKMSEAASLLTNIAAGNLNERFAGALRNESIGFDLARVVFDPVVRLGAVAQGVLDPNRTVSENFGLAGQEFRESLSDVGEWFGDKASSAWSGVQEAFTGVGGSPPS